MRNLLALTALLCGPVVAAAADRPNVLFILVDDLGARDVAAFNPATFYETPHVDRLAGEGMRFTQAYAANPVCSPTRFSIMTGRYPTRVRATNFFPGVRAARFQPAPLNTFMPTDEVTLGNALSENGYRTAFVGKWHLGSEPEHAPERRGFEFNVAGYQRGAPPSYFSPYRIPHLTDGPPGEYLTARLTDEALRILDEIHREPFLLYYSFYAVHTPLQAPEELVAKYRRKAALLPAAMEFAPEEQVWPDAPPRQTRLVQNHPVYAAMVETMDHSVGRLLDKLDSLGVAENTIVWFFSDNGGLSTSEGSPTSNAPLRGGKGWLYEGGIREPMVVRWPGRIAAGSVCDAPVTSVDFFPTLLELTGTSLPADRPIDGVSLAPLLRGEKLPERALFWHYPHYSNQGGFPGGAVRRGDLKLIERYEDGRIHLYDLSADEGETTDLTERLPEQAATLRRELHAWYDAVDARFLEPQPEGPLPWRPNSNER